MIPVAKATSVLSNQAMAAPHVAPAHPKRQCVCGSKLQAAQEAACVCLESDASQHLLPAQVANSPGFERRPAYHLAPPNGWINDPNGPLLHNGTYHLFYQHVPNSSDWQWGLVWGHAKSQDLVNWEHLPVALEPTHNGLDQHGCFSGCATVDVNGRPTLLYTGVIRKTPHEIEPGVSPQHESQLIAVATDLDDPDLTCWQKLPGSFLPHPPADMDLTGWRDPFVLERPTAESPWWYVMIGAGMRGKCGTALVYRSKDLTEGWQYVGPLCESTNSFMWECPVMAHLTNTAPDRHAVSHNVGHIQQQTQMQQHLLMVSPDYCVNMIQYWLGSYQEGKFDLGCADGPFLLDLGDIMYAPNVLTDKHGRTVLWAWMQEKQNLRPAGNYSSACCLCVPRVLYLSSDGKRLMQEPLPELRELRQLQGAWHIGATVVHQDGDEHSNKAVPMLPGQALPVGPSNTGFCSSSVDLKLQVARGDAESFALLLHPFEGAQGAAGAAIAYCWNSNTLQVIHSTDLGTLEHVASMPLVPRPHYRQPGPDPAELAAAEAAAAEAGMPMRCGGHLRVADSDTPADVISLRVLLDGSCVEVFTSTGEALGTRVYRGDHMPAQPPHVTTPQHSAEAALSGTAAAAMTAAAAAGAVGWEELFSNRTAADISSLAAQALVGGQLELVSFGPGPALLLSGSAWQMSSMWQQPRKAEATPAFTAPPASAALPEPAATAVTAAAAGVLQGLVVAEAAAVAAAASVAPVMLPVSELSLDLGGGGSSVVLGAAGDPLPLSPSASSGPVRVVS